MTVIVSCMTRLVLNKTRIVLLHVHIRTGSVLNMTVLFLRLIHKSLIGFICRAGLRSIGRSLPPWARPTPSAPSCHPTARYLLEPLPHQVLHNTSHLYPLEGAGSEHPLPPGYHPPPRAGDCPAGGAGLQSRHHLPHPHGHVALPPPPRLPQFWCSPCSPHLPRPLPAARPAPPRLPAAYLGAGRPILLPRVGPLPGRPPARPILQEQASAPPCPAAGGARCLGRPPDQGAEPAGSGRACPGDAPSVLLCPPTAFATVFSSTPSSSAVPHQPLLIQPQDWRESTTSS